MSATLGSSTGFSRCPPLPCQTRFVVEVVKDATGPAAEFARAYRKSQCQDALRATSAGTLASFCHGDVWSGNILLQGDEVSIIDWQFLTDAPVVTDLALLLCFAADAPMEPVAHEKLVAQYHDALAAFTGSPYPALWDEYQRVGIPFAFAWCVASWGSISETIAPVAPDVKLREEQKVLALAAWVHTLTAEVGSGSK